MRQPLLLTMALIFFVTSTPRAAEEVPPSGDKLGSVTGGDFEKAQLVVANKCVPCHSPKRIEDAIAAGKDLQKIQQQPEHKGVKLTTDENTVLGIFWKQTPLKNRKPLPQ